MHKRASDFVEDLEVGGRAEDALSDLTLAGPHLRANFTSRIGGVVCGSVDVGHYIREGSAGGLICIPAEVQEAVAFVNTAASARDVVPVV